MHRERVAEKLQEKLERVSHMEDRRTILMEHLATLRRDISDLDADIRVCPMPFFNCILLPCSALWLRCALLFTAPRPG